jgi:hypothetical protein
MSWWMHDLECRRKILQIRFFVASDGEMMKIIDCEQVENWELYKQWLRIVQAVVENCTSSGWEFFDMRKLLWLKGDQWSSRLAVWPRIEESQVGVPVIPYHFITSAARLVYQRRSGVWIACNCAVERSVLVTSEVPGSNPGRTRSSFDRGWLSLT